MAKYQKTALVEANQYHAGLTLPGVIYVSRVAGQTGEPYVLSKEGLVGPLKEGDYVMEGIKGEYYICDADIFNKTYKLVEE
jgi:hypothetical protein